MKPERDASWDKARRRARIHAVKSRAHETSEVAALLRKRPDMTWRDHLVMLLYFGAEIEHSLMIQYLYAAYSLDGDRKDPDLRARIERWRSSILSVAKEEMGHLMTVQNVLTLLRAPVNLFRRDFPWSTSFYPFPPKLEPFSRESLACYIYAEMPKTTHPKLGARHDDEDQRAPVKHRRRRDKFQRLSTGEVDKIVADVVAFARPWGFSLDEVKVPVHWWHGDADHIIPYAHGEHCVAALPDATLYTIPGESHLAGLGRAEEILRTVMAVWDRDERATP